MNFLYDHQPFRHVDRTKHRLKIGQVVLVDDAKMTEDDSNKMMFNLLRILVFRPVPIRDFVARCLGPLRDTTSNLEKSGAAHCILSYEIVENAYRVPNGSGRGLPLLSRFGSLALLLDFISKNRLLKMPHNLYSVRVCLAHYVSDCFLYKVVNNDFMMGLQKGGNVLSGNVQIQPLNMFACGKNQSRLGGKSNVGRAQSVLTHVPTRVRSGTPSNLWHIDGNAELYWLPLMEALAKPDEIADKMRSAYYFHKGEGDLAFPKAEDPTV